MRSYKVVVTDYEYDTLDPEMKVLAKAGIELIPTQCSTEDEVIEAARYADGILNQYAPISEKVINNLENCKVISRYGIGFNTIDIEAANKQGIIVSNVTDYCLDEVSDHAFALLMSHARKIVQLNHAVKEGGWDFKVAKPIFRLRNQVLGLVGFGNIPQTLAIKAKIFGLRVIAYDPFIPEQLARHSGVELVELHELCQQSDFISVHAPLNAATKGMISDEQFQQMKKEAFIINTARGPLIDEQALIRALQKDSIAGAALDVVEIEPLSEDSPLREMNRVILTPHTAWYSESAELELKKKSAQNIADVLSGFYPDYIVNKQVEPISELQEK